MNESPSLRVLFITGTDTGVGKTLLTALLLTHLRRRNVPTLAIKPFCSGSRADAQLLYSLQEGKLTLDEINPFYFPEPLAPLVAARGQKRVIGLKKALAQIRSIVRRVSESTRKRVKTEAPASFLLIEGVGGLLVPLGPQYFVLDLIRELRCETIVVSRNKLGTLNHTLLTIRALENAGAGRRAPIKAVLMRQRRSDPSVRSNREILSELGGRMSFWNMPFFGGNLRSRQVIQKIEKKIEKTLAQILD